MLLGKLKISSKLEKKLKAKKTNFIDLFQIPSIRDEIVKDRFVNQKKKIEFFNNSKHSSKNNITHNSNIARMFYKEMSIRPDLITNILGSISSFNHTLYRKKILIIGARTEAEIFSLVRLGVPLKNIKSIDLFSTSKFIEYGDVCNLKFEKSSFDVVICGWVFEFVKNYSLAAKNIKNVAKKNSIICIGGMVHPKTLNLKKYNHRAKHLDRTWYISYQKITKTFKIKNKDIIFKDFINGNDQYKNNNSVFIFSNPK